METLINRELDLRGLNEPVPVLRTRHALHDMQPGDVLMVTTTDRCALSDFRIYCELSGTTMLLSMEEDDMYIILLRKCSRGLN